MKEEFPNRPRILLVEDDLTLRDALENVLAQAGYAVETASNGKEALECHRATPANVVVSDVLMPEKDGLELLLELRQVGPAAQFIAISGGGLMQARLCLRIALGLGATRVLTKPFPPTELLSALDEVLNAA